jgi:hypothetical protein
VKDSATESFETVQGDARAATSVVTDQAQQAREHVADR